MRFIQGDVFSVRLPERHYDLVYADPPYANCRFKYARGNKSRQWGKDARADYMRELIARMDSLRNGNGICAVSMASTEWRLAPLFPTTARLHFWVKPYAPHRPGVWPTYATELMVSWGRRVDRPEQKYAAKTPFDYLCMSPAVPRGGSEHENPKPEGFGTWMVDQTLGPRVCIATEAGYRLKTLELFAGTAIVSRESEVLGCDATAVDLKQWFNLQLHDEVAA
jgi:hypothetical protein